MRRTPAIVGIANSSPAYAATALPGTKDKSDGTPIKVNGESRRPSTGPPTRLLCGTVTAVCRRSAVTCAKDIQGDARDQWR